jgi:SAM-dependent methyltransferase
MIRHKKPIQPMPSNFLAKYGEEVALNSKGIIVDFPSGYGRNAAYIASFGVPVLCIDFNEDALEFIKLGANLTTARLNNPNLHTILKLDLLNDPWPFKDESIGAIINIYFFNPKVMGFFLKSFTIGGFLLLETIDGHGRNYLELPSEGFIKRKLGDAFDIKYFKEKKVGPLNNNASTVKLFAIKRNSYLF